MRDVLLDDPGLLARDLFQAAPKDLNMVETDIGADRQLGSQDIGCIKTSAKADFDNSDIDFLVAEIFESESGDYFKEREFFFTSTERYRLTND